MVAAVRRVPSPPLPPLGPLPVAPLSGRLWPVHTVAGQFGGANGLGAGDGDTVAINDEWWKQQPFEVLP